jgi:uncharacterized protein (TIGR03067 family)
MTLPLTLVVILALGASTLGQQPPADAAATLAAFQGRWVISAVDGKPVAGDGPRVELRITGDSYAQVVDGTVTERGTLTIDTTRKPMTIDLTIKEGADAGKPQVGLIDLAGDTITLHLSMPGSATRPTSMAPEPACDCMVFTATKAK